MVKRDGDPLVEVPVDDWTVAVLFAEVVVALVGGPVSVGAAVIARRQFEAAASADPTIFDALEAAS